MTDQKLIEMQRLLRKFEISPKREWVGLTKKETLELLEKNIDRPFSLLVAVRDKLKEKNAPDL